MSPSRRSPRRLARRAALHAALLLAGAGALAACADRAAVTAPAEQAGSPASLALEVNTAAVPTVTQLVIEVTAADIPTPLVFTLPVADGRASGTLRIPPGTARTFTVRAFDAQGAVTHRGARTLDVAAGTNPALAIPLRPVSAEVPITVTLASLRVELQQATLSLRPGETALVTARVLDADGAALPDAAVTWSSADPAVATVTPGGAVTARTPGTVRLVAVYDGIAAATQLTVGTGRWRAVVAGATHSCALTREGKAYCWGANSLGQLGIGANNPGLTTTPLPVAGNLVFAELASGDHTVCGITTDRKGYCWGAGAAGQLGNGQAGNVNAPREVAGGHQWRVIAPGIEATCGVTTAGRALCWGNNAFGKLGDGTQSSRLAPVAVVGDRTWRTVAMAAEHACGLDVDGAAWCWGMDTYGQLGVDSPAPRGGTNIWSTTPVAVASGTTRFATLSTAGATACAIAALDGRAWCWGDNSIQQLGIPGGGGYRRPTLQPRPMVYAAIRASHQVPCGVRADGSLLCWGQTGQWLDFAEPLAGAEPTFMPIGVWKAADVASGSMAHVCILTTTGQIACAGLNGSGQLGTGTQTASRTFVEVRDPVS